MSLEQIKIMGILNVTPDSFSDGGAFFSCDKAVERACEMEAEGATVVDVGGESTRPGFTPVSAEEEMDRVIPVIRGIRERSDVILSIDTTKYEVAKAAVEAGATIINDIHGVKKDGRLAELAAERGVYLCLMHNREYPVGIKPGTTWGYEEGASSDPEPAGKRDGFSPDDREEIFLRTVCEDLRESIDIATRAGVPKEKIILDPGVGFAKTYEQDLSVIRHVGRIVEMGYPVLMAASRKRVIGFSLDLPVDEREEGGIAISLYAAMKGCAMVRVHDVKKHARALRMWERIRESF